MCKNPLNSFGERSWLMMNLKSEPANPIEMPKECSGCGKKIIDRFLLKALDLYWHEDCLKCGCCDCRLGEVGSTLYTKANLILCKRDYLRLFGSTGYCAACTKVIPAFEMVMRARNNVYHLECFACQQCNHRFCVGDRFYLYDNRILCEYDYEERMVLNNMNNSNNGNNHNNSSINSREIIGQNGSGIHQLKQQQRHHQQQQQQQQQHLQQQQNQNNLMTNTQSSPGLQHHHHHHHHSQQQQHQQQNHTGLLQPVDVRSNHQAVKSNGVITTSD